MAWRRHVKVRQWTGRREGGGGRGETQHCAALERSAQDGMRVIFASWLQQALHPPASCSRTSAETC